MITYSAKTKCTDMKNIMALLTTWSIYGVTKDDKKPPAISKLYNFTKGDTDIADQPSNCYI